jgi:predicted RNA polymerase sigma factor
VNQPEEKPAREVSHVVEHLFRHEGAKMVATLTGIFGVEHLHLAEDVVQEALARALQTWPFYGVPENPGAWIMRASRNLALDVVRRQKVFRDKEARLCGSWTARKRRRMKPFSSTRKLPTTACG